MRPIVLFSVTITTKDFFKYAFFPCSKVVEALGETDGYDEMSLSIQKLLDIDPENLDYEQTLKQ